MNQDQLRLTCEEINECYCAYEKSILARYGDCSKARRFYIAEREVVGCDSDNAQAQCLILLSLIKHQARFHLKNISEHAVISYSKLLRVQVGGLRGLRVAVTSDNAVHENHIITDIYALIEAAKSQFGTLDNLPMQLLVQHIAAFKGRIRHRRRTTDN